MTSEGGHEGQGRPAVKRFAVASIAAAIVTIALKLAAYWITGSVGLLSDALESLVNLAAAAAALAALWVAAMPADEEHAYGHTKAEYLSSGFEGALILVRREASPGPPARGSGTPTRSTTRRSALARPASPPS